MWRLARVFPAGTSCPPWRGVPPVSAGIDKPITNDRVGIDDVALRAQVSALLAQGDIDPLIATGLPAFLQVSEGDRPEPTPLAGRVDTGSADGLVVRGMWRRVGLDRDEDALAPEPRGV